MVQIHNSRQYTWLLNHRPVERTYARPSELAFAAPALKRNRQDLFERKWQYDNKNCGVRPWLKAKNPNAKFCELFVSARKAFQHGVNIALVKQGLASVFFLNTLSKENNTKMNTLFQLRPQGAFPWHWRWRKSALGTRLTLFKDWALCILAPTAFSVEREKPFGATGI